MNYENIINLFLRVENLKTLGRCGWHLAGIDNSETVASHIWGTSFISLILSKMLAERRNNLDLEKVLIMSILHDLPESLVGDISRRAIDLGGDEFKDSKNKAELVAIKRILGEYVNLKDLINIWQEYHEQQSIEARIVRDADVLDMLIHAIILKQQGISKRKLNNFFIDAEGTVFADLFEAVIKRFENMDR